MLNWIVKGIAVLGGVAAGYAVENAIKPQIKLDKSGTILFNVGVAILSGIAAIKVGDYIQDAFEKIEDRT